MRWVTSMAVAIALVVGVVVIGSAESFQLPGVIPPSGCRVGGVLSTEQFTTTGFSNVRTAVPNDEIVVGAWVVTNNFVPDTSVVIPPNCNAAIFAEAGVDDDLGLNLVAVRLKPTINSAAEADIRDVKLFWDVNANALYDPLLDLELQRQPGHLLDTQEGAIFFNGPQNPLAFLSDTAGADNQCFVGADDSPPDNGVGPSSGTNSRNDENGCFIALLAIVVIGDSPQTGSQFGLELEAMAGDIPGTNGISSFTFSSGFSSSRNPQASNVRLHMVGGLPSSHTPIEHISNGSGSPESAVRPLTFTGGQQGEGLLSRFRALEIRPGTREAIAIVVGICDGGELANTIAAILPPIAGAPPTIAGGLASLPCIPSVGTDGYSTGINGATLIFRGPLARYMSTVRMYGDECQFVFVGGDIAAAAGLGHSDVMAQQAIPDLNVPCIGLLPPTTVSLHGGGDGFLFQPGEIIEQVVSVYDEQTGEAIAQFGGRQEQVLFTGNGNVVGNGSDPVCAFPGNCLAPFIIPFAGTRPLILIWTVDIDQNAPGGVVDVLLGLQSYDDTAQNIATGGAGNPCRIFLLTNRAGGNAAKPIAAGTCGSNFLNTGPEIYSFTVEGPEHPSTPNTLAAFDTNDSCFIDDPEFFAVIDGWTVNSIGDGLFFNAVDAWTGQTNGCNIAAAGVRSLRLAKVTLENNGFGTTTFVVSGQGIASMNVSVYNLSGSAVYSQSVSGTHLSWSQTTTNGAPLANGTYLYIVSVEGADGQQIASEVKKLMVLR